MITQRECGRLPACGTGRAARHLRPISQRPAAAGHERLPAAAHPAVQAAHRVL